MSTEAAAPLAGGSLDFEALRAATVTHDPFDYFVVPGFVRAEALQAIVRDYPGIDTPRNYRLEELSYGPAFARFVEELESPEMTAAMAEKFGIDLDDMTTSITVRRYAEASDGNIHTDSWTKAVTMLIYFNEEWTHETGALRMLRSATDIEDYADEVTPLAGTMLAFKRSDRSFHGHKRFEGERRMLQLSWVRPSKSASIALRLKRLTTRAVKHLHIDRASNVRES